MSAEIHAFPQTHRHSTLSPERREAQDARTAQANKIRDDVRQWQRMPKSDCRRIAQNLGDMISELARDLVRREGDVLREVFGEDRLAKRLRYARLPSDGDKKTDEFGSTFADYLALAETVARMRPKGALSTDDQNAEALLRLLEGTSRDPDPHRTARIDYDAARAVASLADAFIRQLEEAVPGLKTYFERLAKYQLFHLPFDDETEKQRFISTLSASVYTRYEFANWRPDYYWPIDLDTSRFVAQFTGDQPVADGPANTMPPTYVYDGMSLVGDADANGISGLFPRIILGDIHTHGLACKSKAVWYEPVQDHAGARDATPWDPVCSAEAVPSRIHMIVAPVATADGMQLQLGLISENWPLSVCEFDESSNLFLSLQSNGAQRWGPLESFPIGAVTDHQVSLIPGVSASRELGLQGVPGIGQVKDEMHNAINTFDDITPELLAKQYLEIVPAIETGTGFTPFEANTLAAALFSNLLYVKGPYNALSMMIADATQRVQTLDLQFNEWMQEFASAKSAFVAGAAKPDENDIGDCS